LVTSKEKLDELRVDAIEAGFAAKTIGTLKAHLRRN
jgi:hypothetical protein